MEFTARVGSILRGLLPRRWITESGRQRLGGLFECLLQKAGVPPPTFYAATPSVCSGNRLASPVHTYCAWIRPSSPGPPPSAPVAGRISKHEHERFLSQLFHPIGRFHWKFPREKIVSSYRVPWISCFPSFPFRTLESIRKFSLLTERIKLHVDYSSFGGISQVSRGKKKMKRLEIPKENWGTLDIHPIHCRKGQVPKIRRVTGYVLSGIPDSTWWLHDSTLRGIKSKRTGRNEDLGGRKTGVIQTNDRAVKEWQLRAIRAMTENLPVHARSSGISSSRFPFFFLTRRIRRRYYPCTFQHASSAEGGGGNFSLAPTVWLSPGRDGGNV